MTQSTFRSVLVAALLAGLLAGLVAGLFHLLATEPVIQHAIDLENALRQATSEPEGPEMVSRPTQRVGLIVGFLLYRLTWGLFFSLAYWLLQRLFSEHSTTLRVAGLTAAGFWALGVLPQLKYPANAPGVGDPENIGYRQGLYVGLLALSALSLLLCALVYRDIDRLHPSWQQPVIRLPIAGGLYAILTLVLLFLLPNNPDPIRMPMDMVMQFRWLSLAGITVFWMVLGCVFWGFVRRGKTDRADRRLATA